MFCPNCGSQSPDGTVFCPKCGADLSAPKQQYPNTAQQYPNTAQQYPNAGQQYPNMGQPPYGAPSYAQMPPRRSAAVPIAIISSVAVVIIVFLILLFTVILPGQSDKSSDNPGFGSSQGQSVESMLKRRWVDQSGNFFLDLKNNKLEESGEVINITWKLKGDDTIVVTGSETRDSIELGFELSSDGNKLWITVGGETEMLTPIY